MRLCIAVAALVAVLVALGTEDAWAHGGLESSDPAAGATLVVTPTAIRLSLSEMPEPSLSTIRVLGTGGAAYQIGRPDPVAGDPLSLIVPVRRLDRGVYTVSWRVVSAVDGHATAGAYSFGVRTSPTPAAAAAQSTNPVSSPLEMLARWVLLAGLVVLLGAASASVARFGGSAGADVLLGAAGWLTCVVGLVLLSEAQRRNANAPIADLLDTSIGQALVWRAVAIGAAGGALLVARQAPLRIRRGAMAGVAVAALAAIAVHVAGGHAAAGAWPPAVTIAVQSAHFAAVGVWLGGLAALLLGVRGAPSAAKAAAVRRFSTIAAAGLIVVVVTGVVRAVDELSSWSELVSSGYGRAVVAKVALLLAIALLGARNRLRSVPAATESLGLLRRTSSAELVLAASALAVAAVLGTLSPPAAGQLLAPSGIAVSGTDLGTTVRVGLTAASAEPGPNRFVVGVVDYDSKEPVRARRVSLRFTPLDDPGVASTSLALTPATDGTYLGAGANLAFDGRWRVTVQIERAADTVRVPLELEVRGPVQFVSIERVPGAPPRYTVKVEGAGYVRVSPDPERAGPSTVEVTCFTVVEDEAQIDQLVLTTSADDRPTVQQPVRRASRGRFAGDVELQEGRNTISVVARTAEGARLRAVLELDVPGG